jgi:hypothetical protein
LFRNQHIPHSTAAGMLGKQRASKADEGAMTGNELIEAVATQQGPPSRM